MSRDLRIVVFAGGERPDYPFIAALVGTPARGIGTSVQDALQDLFTRSLVEQAVQAFEVDAAADLRAKEGRR